MQNHIVGGAAICAVALLQGCGGGQSPAPAPAPAPLPTVSLSALPTSVASGGSSTLTWSSTDSTACAATGGWSGALATKGSQSTGALSAAASYSITCSGAGGTSTPATVTVDVSPPAPTVALSASPTSVMAGATSTLTWTSTGATSCTASGGWTGPLAPNGSQATAALSATTGYSIVCTGAGGTSPASSVSVAVVPVAAAPTVSLAASPAAISSGGRSTLTWSSTNATACTASGGWSGALATSGSQATSTLSTTTAFSLTCSGAGGSSAPASVTVTVAASGPVPAVTLIANPSAIASGGTGTLSWNATNASACTASGGWNGSLAVSGSQSTPALTATTLYSIVCIGSTGLSPTATATVTILNNAITVAPAVAAIAESQTLKFTATGATGSAVTWSVDGVAGGTAAVGTIDVNGLYTAGTAPGTHTVLATGVADPSQNGAASAAVTDLAGVYTYHNDLGRDGVNAHEFALTPATVNTGSFGKQATCPVDGAIYAQPLWVADVAVNGVAHDVVYVATQHDSLYAFDADASPCVLLWSVSLVDTLHGAAAGETSVPNSLVGFGLGDIQPEVGVTSTPVIDPATGTLYVVAKSVDSTQTNFYLRLHAIDITSGAERPLAPVVISGTYPSTGGTVSFAPRSQAQRPGLALVNGVIYVAFGSHEDYPPFYGWLMGYTYAAASGFTQTAVFNTSPNNAKASLWMSGAAPAADADGFLYVVTGNGDFDANNVAAPKNDYGDSLLKLSVTPSAPVTSAVQVSQFFTPNPTGAVADEDFGAGGASVLADITGSTHPKVLLTGGKLGHLFEVDRTALGGSPGTPLQDDYINGIYATGGFWNNTFYIAGASGALSAFPLDPATSLLSATASSTSSAHFGAGGPVVVGSTPSISANGTVGGIVWGLDNANYCGADSAGCAAAVLHAYDATNLGTELWNSGLVAGDHAGNAVKFTVPTIANGRVYVGTRGASTGTSTPTAGELDIYGLKP